MLQDETLMVYRSTTRLPLGFNRFDCQTVDENGSVGGGETIALV